jgi:hypothetical protein
MEISSEYPFPIFISSTDYNLKDLRAELARFLKDLGYNPILSSAEGFPDSSPDLEPWESCLRVLDSSFINVLILDERYGKPLPWPNYQELFKGRECSPTHGEYLYAHKCRKRMLVFIRKSILPHYQSYRKAIKECKDHDEAKKLLNKTLPDTLTFDTLEFINEVKTTKPIPWINEFEDITSIKKEIQKKLLNELAVQFLIKNRHLETVIDSFNSAMDSLSFEEQKKALQKITATKDIINAAEKIEEYKAEILRVKEELTKAHEKNSKDVHKFESKIKELNKKISELEIETWKPSDSQFYIRNGQIQIGKQDFLIGPQSFNDQISNVFNYSTGPIGAGLIFTRKCAKCGKIEEKSYLSGSLSYQNEFKECPKCKKTYCNDCWPQPNPFWGIQGHSILYNQDKDLCPDCIGEN